MRVHDLRYKIFFEISLKAGICFFTFYRYFRVLMDDFGRLSVQIKFYKFFKGFFWYLWLQYWSIRWEWRSLNRWRVRKAIPDFFFPVPSTRSISTLPRAGQKVRFRPLPFATVARFPLSTRDRIRRSHRPRRPCLILFVKCQVAGNSIWIPLTETRSSWIPGAWSAFRTLALTRYTAKGLTWINSKSFFWK